MKATSGGVITVSPGAPMLVFTSAWVRARASILVESEPCSSTAARKADSMSLPQRAAADDADHRRDADARPHEAGGGGLPLVVRVVAERVAPLLDLAVGVTGSCGHLVEASLSSGPAHRKARRSRPWAARYDGSTATLETMSAPAECPRRAIRDGSPRTSRCRRGPR